MEREMQKEITIIPARQVSGSKVNEVRTKCRVAAYCRVSTLKEQQENSYLSQITYYTEKITSNPDWTLVGIYADDGITGTSTKKRHDFNKLLEDCRKGKIDLILTKSISRFARNTVDLLQTIRELKEKNIAVYFEKENINTLDAAGEILITILSSLAQEESRNLSENTKWGIVRKFERGIVQINHKKFMGYTKDTGGNLIIVPEEAEVVSLIFTLYLQGMSSLGIKRELERREIKTVTGNSVWQATVIEKMLRNEKYMGDALLQKTYTVDFLTKKRVLNNGIVPQYYVKNNHEPIVSREVFYRVQQMLVERSINKKYDKQKYSSKYALTGVVYCKNCGEVYRRITWSRNGQKKIVWRCRSRILNGKRNCKNSYSILEIDLQRMAMQGIVQKKEGGIGSELLVELENASENVAYDEVLVRKWINRIEIYEKERIKVLFN